MLFNDGRVLTYHELLEKLQLQENDLKPHLIPLC